MKLLVLSDLHLNHNPYFRFQDEYSDFDVAVFAGDIAETPLRSVLAIADLPQFAGKHKVFQAGNHEYYGKHFQSENDLVLKHTIYPNTHEHYLLRRSVILDDVKFIGAPLWTDYAITGNQFLSMQLAKRFMNDHQLIEYGEGRMTPANHLAEHNTDLAFIASELRRPFHGKKVVVTHHAPHPLSIHARFANDPVNASFASNLDAFIMEHQPDLWIHGHVHNSFDYMVGNTRVVCNPLGYGNENGSAFDHNLVLDI
jgi:Icc-related predicted phosphoesterase